MNIQISSLKLKGIVLACLFAFCACDELFSPDEPDNPITNEHGTGTETDPFKVANVDDLKRVGSGKDGPGGLKWGISNHYKQVAPIDLIGEKNWTPICSTIPGLTGSYDGDGYTISNLTIVEDKDNYSGLFKDVAGTVTNVRLTKVNISGKFYVGSVAGRVHVSGKIDHCFIDDFSITGESVVGGVVGHSGNLAYESIRSTIRNCIVSNGTVLCTDYGCGGGIAGSNTGTIENCYAAVYVSGTDAIGGVVGNNRGVVQYCYATGNITAEGVNAYMEDEEGQFVGGIAGANIGSTDPHAGTIQNCVALNREVKRTGVNVLPPQIGRIVGANGIDGKSLNNYARPDMTLTSNATAVSVGDMALTSIHGANVSSADYNGANSGTWWSGTAGFPSSSWDFASNRLPHLQGFGELTQTPAVTP